jgi:ubiquinone/menaquinone biosynthesis C-methylase UbiE
MATRSSSFDGLADAYDRYRIGYADDVYDALDHYGLPPQAHILDIASGTGLVAEALVRRGHRVTGIDISEPMLARAEARVPSATFVLGDAEALPFANASFDAAVSAQAFHWFDRTKALAEAIRVVRPGGIVAVWWKELMRGDTMRLVREEVSHDIGIDNPMGSLLAEDFDAFEASALIDDKLRVIPWLVQMTVEQYLGYERSRARSRDSYGDRLDAYLTELAKRLGRPDTLLSLTYLHLVYLGRVPTLS